ncbi:hypothetical protein [Magnetospirillum fulvum]|uniref:Uncharacterized protein n=1 Tax=Magnetospirillum fulvum TaxID=1082 RepID=A0A1H6GR06_MAGFU|nr:hypothetical protein [Magnetospirillum fulvum]SEH25741.1 hypothetical protein SAMN04244559_00288 [Magnetospirillum fulvum]
MSPPADRHARQAEALRANLARRKAQSRARADEPLPPPPESETPPETGADKSAPPPE